MAIELKFEMTLQLIDEARSTVAKKMTDRFWTWMILNAFGTLILEMIVFKNAGSEYVIFSLGIFLFVMYWVVLWNYRRTLNKRIKETGICEYIFSNENILVRFGKCESKIQWGYFKKMQETAKYFFLFKDEDSISIIPKSAFTSDKQMDEFREMLDLIRTNLKARHETTTAQK